MVFNLIFNLFVYKPIFCFKKYKQELKSSGLIAANKKNINKLIVKYKYHNWIKKSSVYNESLISAILEQCSYKPVVSLIVPTFNTEIKFLQELYASVTSQYYANWELCFADGGSSNLTTISYLKKLVQQDKRVKLKLIGKNLHISANSNQALGLASGDFIGILDHDDTLTTNALLEVVYHINQYNPDFLYSDEDLQNPAGLYINPHYKEGYSKDLLLSINYLGHFAVIKKSLIEQVGGFAVGVEGSQDHDLFLKISEITDRIHHIPKILYHWRQSPTSVANDLSTKPYAWHNGRMAVELALARRGYKAKVFLGKYPCTYKIDYEIIGQPLISVVINFTKITNIEISLIMLKNSINSILNNCYSNVEVIVIINNDSIDQALMRLISEFTNNHKVQFQQSNIKENTATVINYAVDHWVHGAYILLFSYMTTLINKDGIKKLLEHAQHKEVGATGAIIYDTAGKVQQAGVVIDLNTELGYYFKLPLSSGSSCFEKISCVQNISALTAHCLLIKKDYYLNIGGMNEKDLPLYYYDLDFCLRLIEKGWLNVLTPYCQLCDHSHNVENWSSKDLWQQQFNYFKHRHDQYFNLDPYGVSQSFT